MDQQRQGLWDFALKLYGAPGVADACLLLQDESGVDVTVLLFSAWLAANSVALTDAEMARIDVLVKDWREEVVKPLRAIRRRLKTGPFPAPGKETETLRNGVKGVELGAEKIELAVLETEGEAMMTGGRQPTDGAANLVVVLKHYAGAKPDSRSIEALAVMRNALTVL